MVKLAVNPKKYLLLLTGLFLFLLTPCQTPACTIFGASGGAVRGGGVLVGKTRDRAGEWEQVFVNVDVKQKYTYRGIGTRGRPVTSGVNEKGLVVVSAAASNMDRNGHRTQAGEILATASSVREALDLVRHGRVHGPIHYIFGDKNQVALVEVLKPFHHEFLIKENGTVAHTNHFMLTSMRDLNQKVSQSSLSRLERMETLLSKGPFDKADFIAFTQDHHNGPGSNSICRHTGDRGRVGEQTLSAIVFFLPKEGPPEVWASLDRPCTMKGVTP